MLHQNAVETTEHSVVLYKNEKDYEYGAECGAENDAGTDTKEKGKGY